MQIMYCTYTGSLLRVKIFVVKAPNLLCIDKMIYTCTHPTFHVLVTLHLRFPQIISFDLYVKKKKIDKYHFPHRNNL
jgi:hypothetical protein